MLFNLDLYDFQVSMEQARKALRALKGLVKLLAIVRGRTVRRRAMKNLKCLQSDTKMYPQVKEKSTSTTKVIYQDSRRKQSLIHKDELRKDFKVGQGHRQRWRVALQGTGAREGAAKPECGIGPGIWTGGEEKWARSLLGPKGQRD